MIQHIFSVVELIITLFLGDNVDCWMEIQQGKGPWASPVTGIVPLGTTLTMVVGIDDKEGKFISKSSYEYFFLIKSNTILIN